MRSICSPSFVRLQLLLLPLPELNAGNHTPIDASFTRSSVHVAADATAASRVCSHTYVCMVAPHSATRTAQRARFRSQTLHLRMPMPTNRLDLDITALLFTFIQEKERNGWGKGGESVWESGLLLDSSFRTIKASESGNGKGLGLARRYQHCHQFLILFCTYLDLMSIA